MPTLSYLQLKQALKKATTPTLYNVTCTLADVEYSQSLPGFTKKFMVKPRHGALQVCFVEGESGTVYEKIADGGAYYEDLLGLEDKWLNLRFRSPATGAVAEILAWE